MCSQMSRSREMTPHFCRYLFKSHAVPWIKPPDHHELLDLLISVRSHRHYSPFSPPRIWIPNHGICFCFGTLFHDPPTHPQGSPEVRTWDISTCSNFWTECDFLILQRRSGCAHYILLCVQVHGSVQHHPVHQCHAALLGELHTASTHLT